MNRIEERKPVATTAARAALRTCVGPAVVFTAVANLLLLVPAIYSLQVYDRVIASRSEETLAFLTLILLLALAAYGVFDAIRNRLLLRAGLRLDRRLSALVLCETMVDTGADTARRQGIRDLDTIRAAVAGAPAIAVLDAPWSAVFLLVAFLLHPAVGALILAGGLALCGLALANERATRTDIEQATLVAARVNATSDTLSQSAEVVRALGMGAGLIGRLQANRAEALMLQLGAAMSGGIYQAISKWLRLSLQSLVLGLGAWLVIGGDLTSGGMFACSLLAGRTLGPLESVVGQWRNIVQARLAWRNLGILLNGADLVGDRTILPAPAGRLALQQVVVQSGPEHYPLKSVSLTVSPGEIVGLVGPSGAGKSTLIRVAAGALRPRSGVVRIDGADRDQWDSDRLACHFGWLPQEIVLLAGTIKENISRFADAASADTEVVRAAQHAGVHDMILALPRGYDTPLGVGGRGLSGGQAQRIALARALYGEPPILVMDEPDAHLDADGELALVAAMQAAKARGAAILLVGHRQSLMRHTDRIVTLRDGRIETDRPTPKVIRAAAAVEGRAANIVAVEPSPAPAAGAPGAEYATP
jgi:ATP-binding cassette subfamily C protein